MSSSVRFAPAHTCACVGAAQCQRTLGCRAAAHSAARRATHPRQRERWVALHADAQRSRQRRVRLDAQRYGSGSTQHGASERAAHQRSSRARACASALQPQTRQRSGAARHRGGCDWRRAPAPLPGRSRATPQLPRGGGPATVGTDRRWRPVNSEGGPRGRGRGGTVRLRGAHDDAATTSRQPRYRAMTRQRLPARRPPGPPHARGAACRHVMTRRCVQLRAIAPR